MIDFNRSLPDDALPVPPAVTAQYLATLNARWAARRAAIVAKALAS